MSLKLIDNENVHSSRELCKCRISHTQRQITMSSDGNIEESMCTTNKMYLFIIKIVILCSYLYVRPLSQVFETKVLRRRTVPKGHKRENGEIRPT